MPDIPKTQRAVTAQADKSVKVTTIPTPEITGQDQVIVKVYSVAQNPTDWKSLEGGRVRPDRIVGNDLSGVIIAAGSDVTNVKVGDRVATLCAGSFVEEGTGAFNEYSRVPGRRCIHIPDTMSMNEAATIPLAALTACSGLYQMFKLPEPPAALSDTPILVWAGSTSVGMYVIQLAALSGLQVITTASPKNFDLLKMYGAKHCLDYASPTVVEDISRLTGERLEYIFDCISTGGSTQTAVKTLPGAGGKVAVLLPIDQSTLEKKVEVHHVFLYKIVGKELRMPDRTVPASPEDKIWAEEMCAKLSKLVLEGKLKGNPVKVMGGLATVEEGFKYMKDGKVHAQKLVYEVVKE